MTAHPLTRSDPVRVLAHADVERVLDLPACIDAVEDALRAAAGARAQSAILGLHARDGGLHGKAAYLEETDDENAASWIVAKLNSNFPHNPRRHGLPTIQGLVALFDGRCGRLLALMDSGALTVLRTAAATGVAARYLARRDASSVTIIGCGAQALAQIRAVAAVRPIRRVVTIDAVPVAADRLATRIRADLGIAATARVGPRGAPHETDIVITCTPSTTPFLGTRDVLPGTFVAAVGTDNDEKSEIEPELMCTAVVVVDSLAQASTIGDLHHAIAAGVMTPADVRGELGALLAGSSPIAWDPRRVVIFDSTGVAVEDVAAAVLAFRRAKDAGVGAFIDLAAGTT
jgi:ornithine cyclodeaminase/alanine dehydrogenase-like protein (mu-crystallin family)